MSRRTKTSLARKCFTSLNSCFIMIINKEKKNQYLVACMNCILLIWPTATLGVHMDDLYMWLGIWTCLYWHISEITLQNYCFRFSPALWIAVCSTRSSAGPKRVGGWTKNLCAELRSENGMRRGRNKILSQWTKQERSDTWVCKKYWWSQVL